MKILVLNLQGAAPESFFNDERLENLRRLMDMGCFGEMIGEPSELPAWSVIADHDGRALTLQDFFEQANKKCVSIGEPGEFSQADGVIKTSQENFSSLRTALEKEEWDFCQLIDHGLDSLRQIPATYSTPNLLPDYYLHFDRELESILQLLSDDTVIGIVSGASERRTGCFVIVSSTNPVSGKQAGRSEFDLAPTLLELAGFPLPSLTKGNSLVAGLELKDPTSGLTADEEEILRERLSGLGYL